MAERICPDCGEIFDDDGKSFATVIDGKINITGNPFFWFCFRCWRIVRVAFNGEPVPFCPYCKRYDRVELEC